MRKIIIGSLLLFNVSCTDVVYVTQPQLVTKTDTIIKTRVDTVQAGLQKFNININWSKFTASSNLVNDFMVNSMSDSSLSITHVGVRLEYPKQNASFTQSTVRDGNVTKLITMNVPAADSVNLYLLAVYNSGGPGAVRKALKMGIRRNITVPTSGEVNLTLDSLVLYDTDWVVDTTVSDTISFVNDTILVTRSKLLTRGLTSILIRDIYQLEDDAITPYSNRFVKWYGSGYERGNPFGWRKIEVFSQNNSTTTSVDTFWPYIDGKMFNLTDAYLVGKQGIIKTTWR